MMYFKCIILNVYIFSIDSTLKLVVIINIYMYE